MTSWIVRTFRGRRLDRNPLRRPSDRAETLAGIWLLVIFAVVAPLVARAAASQTYLVVQHARSVALATRHEVTAVTLQTAPPVTSDPYAVDTDSWVSARWTSPDGSIRTGQIRVTDSTPKGTSERIWITASGEVAPPPPPTSEFSSLASVAAVSSVLLLAVLYLTARFMMRYLLNRRRMAAWESDWTTTEPRWTHHQNW